MRGAPKRERHAATCLLQSLIALCLETNHLLWPDNGPGDATQSNSSPRIRITRIRKPASKPDSPRPSGGAERPAQGASSLLPEDTRTGVAIPVTLPAEPGVTCLSQDVMRLLVAGLGLRPGPQDPSPPRWRVCPDGEGDRPGKGPPARHAEGG